ncbi:hypothetical protein, partial [Candidatus Vampirococcus lugosii]
EIHICEENDILNGCYSEIKIDSISDNLISIIIKNGKIIDFNTVCKKGKGKSIEVEKNLFLINKGNSGFILRF